MKVAQVNSPLASTHGQPAEEPSNRADAFARVLQTAVFGRGSEAVAKTTERTMAAAAPRTETRPVERRERAEPAATRPNTTPAPRRDAPRDTDARDTAAAQKPGESAKTPTETKHAKDTAEKPAAGQTEKAPENTDATAPQQDAAAQPVDQTVEQTAEQPEAQDVAGDTAEETLPEDAGKPVVADAPDAALILALLQTQVVPVDAAATAAAAPIAVPAAEAAAVAAVPVASVLSPEEAAAALAAAAEAQTKAATPVQTDAADAEPVEAKAAAPVLTQPALPAGAAESQIKTATDTSAAALLSQQTVSAEDFATLQQALTAQNQGQVQVQGQAGKPAVTTEAKQKAEPKADKTVTVDVQTVTVAPKTLVDQAALFAMQDDDQAAADTAQLQQQAQAALQQAQPATSELKFNAALLQAAADDIAVQAGSTASSSGTSGQQSAAIGATTATQATQATHQAATQTAARHLNAYVPVGEQVGVQIKKGVAEGLDKISIKLDPGNLGKVEIKLEIGHDGRLQAVIAADKPETLQLLQQDVKNLEQSLRDAGLKTDQQSLNFTLRDQSQANEGRDGNGAGNGRHQNRGGDEYAETGANTDPAQLAAANAQRAATARGGLDIRI